MLGCIVEQRAGRLSDDVFEGHALELGAFLQLVELVDVGLVVLAIVVFHGFLGIGRCERIQCIRQFGKLVFHDWAPCGDE